MLTSACAAADGYERGAVTPCIRGQTVTDWIQAGIVQSPLQRRMQLTLGCSAVRQTGPGVNHNLSTMVVCISETVSWPMTKCCPFV